MDELKWYFFPRNSLPEALLSAEAPELLGGRIIANPTVTPGELVLGYSANDLLSGYYAPSIFILPEHKSAEVMAWLKIYAPETSPLSQFGRVLSHSDYNFMRKGFPKAHKYSKQLDRWPSIILGEILAQGDMESSIGMLPLSRAQATFSNAVARATICHDNDALTDNCIERLELLETDRKFVARTLTIKDLKPIWLSSSETWNTENPITSIVNLFISTIPKGNDLFSNQFPLPNLNDYPDLLSDSVESRVLAYRNLSTSMPGIADESRSTYFAANIAVAAFLVGRSTSHAFLLKDIGRKIPAVYAWFGLIAGLVGPKYWEVDWARAAKGIEKSLRSKLSWSEPSHSDLSWPEYTWLTKTFTNNPFLELPKQLPKVLSLEIIPGAVCQLRLKQDTNNYTDSRSNMDIELQELNSLRNTIADFIGLAEKAKFNLSTSYQHPKKSTTRQSSEEKNSKASKRARRSE